MYIIVVKQHCFLLTGHCPLEIVKVDLAVVTQHLCLPVLLVALLEALHYPAVKKSPLWCSVYRVTWSVGIIIQFVK